MTMHTVHLTERDAEFISEQIAAGEYQDADDVLRAGLRLLKHQSQVDSHQLALLKLLANSGFDSLGQGQGLACEDPQELAAAVARMGQRSATSSNP